MLVISNGYIHPEAAVGPEKGGGGGVFPQLELHILSFMCEYLHMDVYSHTGHLAPVCETHTLQV